MENWIKQKANYLIKHSFLYHIEQNKHFCNQRAQEILAGSYCQQLQSECNITEALISDFFKSPLKDTTIFYFKSHSEACVCSKIRAVQLQGFTAFGFHKRKSILWKLMERCLWKVIFSDILASLSTIFKNIAFIKKILY